MNADALTLYTVHFCDMTVFVWSILAALPVLRYVVLHRAVTFGVFSVTVGEFAVELLNVFAVTVP